MSERMLPTKERKLAIGATDGRFVYPSTAGKGFDPIDYPRRAPMVGGKPGAIQNTTLKMKELPDMLIHDLNDAYQQGQLRTELSRHLGLLEGLQLVDAGTLKMLRLYERDLTGHSGPDGDTLECVSEVLRTLRPEERQP